MKQIDSEKLLSLLRLRINRYSKWLQQARSESDDLGISVNTARMASVAQIVRDVQDLSVSVSKKNKKGTAV